MSKVFLYAHGGSGNHGCEAIVRATAQILCDTELTLISSSPWEDCKYGLDKLCTIICDRSKKLNKAGLSFLSAYAALKLKNDFIPMDKQWYLEAFNKIHPGNIAISIGGDNYCYADVYKYTMFHEMAKRRGAKTVLWGCSVEPEIIKKPNIAEDLAKYDLITARESVSYEVLNQVNKNTILIADPAFCMDAVSISLPVNFIEGNTVGINISPMIISNEKSSGMTYENYKQLIKYILIETDANVALIPHVVWESNDDRKVLRQLYDDFDRDQRLILVEDHTAPELKYIISKCSFFVGARTHATIAAYSSCVPTLAVGYSVKARGIARDIFGTEDGYVLPVQDLYNATQLVDKFKSLYNRKTEIQQYLTTTMPEYISAAFDATAAIEGLKQN